MAVAAARSLGLHELLAQRSAQWGERTAYVICESSGEERSISYSDLHHRALEIGELLREQQAEGQRVLLAHADRFAYAAGFFGCLHVGAVAVSAYAPERARPAATLGHLGRLATLTDASHALASAEEIAIATQRDRPDGLRWVDSAMAPSVDTDVPAPPADPDAPAYIQGTSGSTGEMKGVLLSHRSFTANLELQRSGLALDEQSVIVTWLTLAHDMGFVGPLLQPLWTGCRSVFLSPVSFLVKPVRWLQTISRHGGTITAGPDFAYDLAARRVTFEERDGLDLSSLACAINGSEPVRAETLQRFEAAFAPVGFRPQAWVPLYGLAEMTSQAAAPSRPPRPRLLPVDREALSHGAVRKVGADAPEAQVLVGCGGTPSDHRLLIVNPDTHEPAGTGQIGEIWTAGPSAALGYVSDPGAPAVFGAQLADGTGPFVRTGDLGFIHDGDLYITGRLKEIINLAGRTHSPHDIEATVAAADPRLTGGRGAALALRTGDYEQLAIVHELSDPRARDTARLIDTVRAAVARRHGVRATAVVLVEPGAVPVTGSGKVRRGDCRELLAAGGLTRVIAADPPLDA